jgi:uncharacterized heparinase superfamily protein
VQRLIVNCGAPDTNRAAAREAARTTAAHSTLGLADTSSCHFAAHSGGFGKWFEGQILSGPTKVSVERHSEKSGHVLFLSHDGYRTEFGLIHERRLALDSEGKRLEGEDRLIGEPTSAPMEDQPFVLRFHIHPNVRARRIKDGKGIFLEPLDERPWIFEASVEAIEIEESIFFAAPDGPRHNEQIVVYGRTGPEGGAEVKWSFRRVEKKTIPAATETVQK